MMNIASHNTPSKIKIDNKMKKQKADMRIKYLPEKAKVLDLFCGNGEMYKRAYKDNVIYYHGVDKEKIHDNTLCEIGDNVKYIQRNDISQYNVFDLDDYGSPWKQLYMIIQKIPEREYTIFMTDGIITRQRLDETVTKFISATERIPLGMTIHGLNRYYIDVFGTMLRDLENRYGCKLTFAKYFFNTGYSVCYWAIRIEKCKQ